MDIDADNLSPADPRGKKHGNLGFSVLDLRLHKGYVSPGLRRIIRLIRVLTRISKGY